MKQEIQDRIDAIDNLDQTLTIAINNESAARKEADNELNQSIIALGVYVKRVDLEHQNTVELLDGCKQDVETLQSALEELTKRVEAEERKTDDFEKNIEDILDRLDELDKSIETITNSLSNLESKKFIEENDEVVLKCGGALD